MRQTVEPLRLFYDQRGRVQEGIQTFSQTLIQLDATLPEHRAAFGYVLVHQAYLYLRLGRYGQVAELTQQGLDVLRPLGETRGIILGLNALGAATGSSGDYTGAKPYLEEALGLAREAGDDAVAALSLDNLAAVEQSLGNYAQTKRYQQESLDLARRLGNSAQVIMNLNNLGTLVLNTDGSKAAIPLLQEGLKLARKIGMQRMVPFFLANLGLASYKLEEHGEAQSLYQEALGLLREHGERWLEAAVLADLGQVAIVQADYLKAQSYFKGSLKHSHMIQDVPTMLYAIVRLSELYARREQGRQAAKLLSLALQHLVTNQEDIDLAQKLLEDFKEHIPPETMAEAREWGKTANLEEVVEEVLRQLETEAPSETSAG